MLRSPLPEQPDRFLLELPRELPASSFSHGRLQAHCRASVDVHKTRAGSGEATRLLTEFRDLLKGLRLELPGLQNGDLAGDIAMLDEYTTLLGIEAVAQPGTRNYLSDSLRYAA